MENESLEKRLARLEEENKKFKLELERAQAINEVCNLMGKMQAYHSVGRDDQIGALFSKRPDTRVYFGELGYFEGADASDRAGAGMAGSSKVGQMAFHLMVNPIIRVAGDGQTAQATFVAAGMVAMKDSKTGEPTAMWEWNRYGDDFIKEDGQWKIWHHHVYPLFRCGWDDKWADQFAPKEGMVVPLPFKPDYPPTPLDTSYSPGAELPFIPIPKPYTTWTEVEPY